MITQGKWTVQTLETAKDGYPDWNTYCIRASNNCHLATVGGVDRFFEENAGDNARLIAASPELLEACKAVRDSVHRCPSRFVKKSIVKMVLDAIAKAEGKI